MGGLDWAQFKALIWVIRKGEETDDDILGLGEDGGSRAGRLVGMVISFILIAALMFMGGLFMGVSGASVVLGFNLIVGILVLVSLTMGFYTAVSSLFLVRDLSFYVALPVSGQTIMWAKFANYLMNAVLMDAAILPLGVGLLIGRGEGLLTLLFMVVAFILCALAVNVAMVLLVLPLMRFSKLAADKDRFSRALGAVITLVVVGISVASSIGGQMGQGIDGAAVASVAQGVAASPAMRIILAILCPPSALGGVAFGEMGPVAFAGLLGMVVLLGAYAALLNWCAGKWYFEAVRGLAGGAGGRSNKRYDAAELGSRVAGRSQLRAFVAVDAAQLFRVPYFFNQFVLSQWLVPIILVAVLGFNFLRDSDLTSFEQVRAAAAFCRIDTKIGLMPLVVTVLLAVFTGIQSYACGQAVARDGQDFFFFRTMPIDLRAYAKAKFVTNELVGRTPAALLLLVGMLVVGLPVLTTLVCFAIFVLSVACADLASLAVGMRAPRLDWESEAQLVKGNESFGAIFACIVITILVMVLPALCYVLPILLEVEVGAWSSVAAIAICALELVGIASLAFGPCVRRLATIEP